MYHGGDFLTRHCSNFPGSLSGPDDFDISILSSNIKTQFSEICRGLILGHWAPGNWGNLFTEWGVKIYSN